MERCQPGRTFGYFFGVNSSKPPQFREYSWDQKTSTPTSRNSLSCGSECSDTEVCLLLWVNNSQSSVYGVNINTCRPEEGPAVLSHILTLCDACGIKILAFWIPHELNRVLTFSHFQVGCRLSSSLPVCRHSPVSCFSCS